MLRVYQVDNVKIFASTKWMTFSGMRQRNVFRRLRSVGMCTHICREIDGPYFYETALESDSLLLKEAKNVQQRGTIMVMTSLLAAHK